MIGRTSLERKVFIVFMIRGNKIRIISARDMNRKEKQIYDQKEKNT
ncbi:MAG: BrnT family toxin [Candidatus Pacebacteria bacterium]|nr:BrnT family toxin [Candidatus Paceibacterota bacterium]